MKSGRGSRRSIRNSVFIGVLAVSVFSGSGAFAAGSIPLVSISDQFDSGTVSLETGATYEAGDPTAPGFLGDGLTYFGNYSGIFTGNGATITGLTVPLFNTLNGSTSDLYLETADTDTGVTGQGILSNFAGPESSISNVHASGIITSTADNAGGLVGESQGAITASSTTGSISSIANHVGGLVGQSSGQISNSTSSMSVSAIIDSSGTGGLVGFLASPQSSISSSSVTGNVTVMGGEKVGGLVGQSLGRISDSHVALNESDSTNVLGGSNVGGLVGYSSGPVSGSSVGVAEIGTVNVSGDYGVGGLVGRLEWDAEVTSSFSSATVQGIAEVGGLVGAVNSIALDRFQNPEALLDDRSPTPGAHYLVGDSLYVGDGMGWTLLQDFDTQEQLQTYVIEPSLGDHYLVGNNLFVWDGALWKKILNIYNSESTGSVSGNHTVGGLVGKLNYLTSISDSRAEGDASASVNISFNDGVYFGQVMVGQNVGGLVGEAKDLATIDKSHAYGDASSVVNIDLDASSISGALELFPSWNIGGLVGNSAGSIISSTARGDTSASVSYVTSGSPVILENLKVYSARNLGGLIGLSSGLVTLSSASGNVSSNVTLDIPENFDFTYSDFQSGRNFGGLIGASYGSSIFESFATGSVNGEATVGGLVGLADRTIYQGTIRGVQTTADETYYCEIPSFSCLSSKIERSYSTGAVTATGGIAGGLVGKLYSGAIFNSYSTSNVLGGTTVGGLVGRVYNYGQNSNLSYEGSPFENYYGLVENSYATGTINIGYPYANRIGGLVGILNSGKIVNSYATAGGLGVDASFGCDHVGGLVGDGSGFEGIGSAGIIQDSFAYIEGNVSAGCGLVGGLAGSMGAGSTITNSFAYVGGTVFGGDYAGGLIGYFTGDLVDVQDSYALVSNLQVNEESRLKGTFTVHVEWTGESFITTPINFTEEQEIELPVLPSIASVVNTDYEIGTEPFEVSSCLNSGIPYLKSLEDTYPRSDSPECSSDDGSGDTPPGEDTGGSEDTPPSDRPIRERVEREVREVTETRTSEKIEKAIGFKNENPLPKSAPIAFVEATEKIDLAKVKAVEIAPSANVKVAAKAGEALQISLKSESKEPVELWVKSPDGSWLLAGVITFDKDGKAILPPIQFKNAGDYTLVLNKPSVDSAKGSAPLNQSGSVLVAVS